MTAEIFRHDDAFASFQLQNMEVNHRHEVQFCSDDSCFLHSFSQFTESALKAQDGIVVIATQPHCASLRTRLQESGLDMRSTITQGRYIELDATDTLSAFMVNDLPDRNRFLKLMGDLIVKVTKAAKKGHPRVAICGEYSAILWAERRAEAAIRLERLWNELANTYSVDILCGYPWRSFGHEEDSNIFRKICAEHSAIFSR
jgi:hypothetical protein